MKSIVPPIIDHFHFHTIFYSLSLSVGGMRFLAPPPLQRSPLQTRTRHRLGSRTASFIPRLDHQRAVARCHLKNSPVVLKINSSVHNKILAVGQSSPWIGARRGAPLRQIENYQKFDRCSEFCDLELT